MTTIETQLKTTRRKLVIHDGLAFLILLAVTGVLFAITLFLFRSFSTHRADLAHEAGDRGRLALSQNRPKDAIVDLREALSYAPNEHSYELLLAQALADDGRLEEATNYFLTLWDSQPGDGFINLQLARLSRQQHHAQAAVNYYRASVFGNWNGDGVIHRRDARLELASYLVDQKQFALARAELLIASTNAPGDPNLTILIGDAMLRANDSANALNQYRKVMSQDPRNAIAFEKAGRLAYKMGDYAHARDWLEKALRESAGSPGGAADPDGDTATLLKNSERLQVLQPELANIRSDQVTRILDDRAIAKKRFDACLKQIASTNTLSGSMDALAARWTASATSSTRAALLRDDAAEDLVRTLVDDTESLTAQICGPPQGDDALLLLLAQRSRTP